MPKFLAVGVPSLGTVSAHWAAAYSDLAWPMNYGVTKLWVVGKDVASARNEIVARALAFAGGRVTHLFFIDDDVLIHRTAAVQLMRRHVPICSGVYFTKSDPAEPLIFPGPLEGTDPFLPDQFRPVWGHGMGCTLIAREVFERMQQELDLGVDAYGHPQWYCTLRNEPTTMGSVASASEDLYFLDHAAQLGYQPHIDTTVHCFGWHFDKQTQVGYPLPQWREWQESGRITWDTPDGPVTWSL